MAGARVHLSFRFIFHVLVILMYCFSIRYDTTNITREIRRGTGRRWLSPNFLNFFPGSTYKLAYLTIWDEIFQTFFFFWCCITDLVLTSGSRTPIAKKFVAFRDWFLAAVAFPIGTLVVAMFWAIWAVDRELVFPKELDEFFPPWLNHVLHTTVLPILLVEMFLVQHKLPSRKAGVLGTLGVGLMYLSWILYLGYGLDIWVYPVLQALSGIYFGIFLTATSFILLGLYIVGEKISEFCWRGYPDSDYEFTKID